MRNLLPILSLLFLVGCYDELPSENACHWTDPACGNEDWDGDGVVNQDDDFPADANQWCDVQRPECGLADWDKDGVINKDDAFPEDPDCSERSSEHCAACGEGCGVNQECTDTGWCVCKAAFAGDDCLECASQFTGDACEMCSGGWTGEAGDVCPANWMGKSCDTCAHGWTGEACNVCPDNYSGDNCETCANAWEGPFCATCPGNWTGLNCDVCSGVWAGEQCDVCPPNYQADLSCVYCSGGWIGDSCDVCPSNWSGDNCDVCAGGWSGDSCDTCLANWTGESCDSCAGGWSGDSCDVCPPNWTGDNCNVCAGGWTGDSCDTCNDKDASFGESCVACKEDLYPNGVCDTFCHAEITCSGLGVCKWNGTCDCDTNITGANCDRYRFKQIDGEWYHTCGILEDGTVLCWGQCEQGQCTPPNPKKTYTQISAGQHFTCGIRTTGEVDCWGVYTDQTNPYKTVEDWGAHPVTGQVSAPGEVFTDLATDTWGVCAIRYDKSVSCWGNCPLYLAAYEAIINPPDVEFQHLCLGAYGNCGLTTSNQIVCWAIVTKDPSKPNDNSYFLWQPVTYTSPNPNPYAAVDCGGHSGLSMLKDGTLKPWVHNGYYPDFVENTEEPAQGDADWANTLEGWLLTAAIEGLTFKSIDMGRYGYIRCGILDDDTAHCWWQNPLPAPPAETFSSVSACYEGACGHRADGSVTCWGNNKHGELIVPSPL
jgi:hypothetical protein